MHYCNSPSQPSYLYVVEDRTKAQRVCHCWSSHRSRWLSLELHFGGLNLELRHSSDRWGPWLLCISGSRAGGRRCDLGQSGALSPEGERLGDRHSALLRNSATTPPEIKKAACENVCFLKSGSSSGFLLWAKQGTLSPKDPGRLTPKENFIWQKSQLQQRLWLFPRILIFLLGKC